MYKIISISAFVLVSGCASVSNDTNKMLELRAQSDFRGVAQLYMSKDQKPKYNAGDLNQTLEAAKAFHDAGLWKLSNEAFARAHELMPWKEDTVDTPKEVVDLIATTMSSSAFGAYQGKVYEGGMIDYYRALNQLMMKDDNARVSFNRLQERQRNAVSQLGAYTRASANNASKGAQKAQQTGANVGMEKIQSDLTRGTSKINKSIAISEIRNSAGDVMSAIFRSTSSDPQDRDGGKVQPILAAASESVASAEGKTLITQLKKYLAENETSFKNMVTVLYEDGNGPTFSEFRLDLPMYLVSNNVLYSGIALPEFQNGQAAGGHLLVGENYSKTVLLTDVNRITGLEFEKAYEGVVTKAIVSAVLKTVAQNAVNAEIDRQVRQDKVDPLAGLFMQVGAAATQAATTKADIRSWRNLPNTIQIALVPRPKSGSMALFTSTREQIGNVEMPEEGNYLVLVKSASPKSKPVFYVNKL